MPPKKKQRITPSTANDLQIAFASSKPAQLAPDRLSNDLLARAYGLAHPEEGATHARVCQGRWNDAQDAQADGQGGVKRPGGEDGEGDQASTGPEEGKGKGKQKEDTEVIVVDSADEDFAPAAKKKKVVKGATSSSGKGKGRQQAEEEVKHLLCAAEHCEKNPRCLNWLGQEKWENAEKALKDFKKASGLAYSPENDREKGIPVGLRNLGATCYANSFLQVWYRDARFRAAVYSCLPASNGKVDVLPIFQLQVLFAFLQTSIQGVYDPSPLIESLKLDTSEQQDAQEFSKLFLQVLDREFKKQGKRAEQEGGDGSIGRVVEELFEGKMKYVTTCERCGNASERPSTFLELEVNLTKDCKLEERIAKTLTPEMLVEDNQYFCERCDSKQDAARKSELTDLPPVLHFSLIRFAWNPKTYERYKSQHAITYPLQLDMAQFLPQAAGAGGVVYDLKGVLMHKGTSAHSGHYVAQVYDETESKWFLFDDESVSPIADLNAPTVHDEDGDPVVSKKKLGTGFTRDGQGNILPKSKDAYMLVYIRRDPQPASESFPSASTSKPASPASGPLPPPLAEDAVERLDEVYKQELAAYKQKAEGIEEAFNALREKKRSVYRIWDVENDDEDAFLVDKSELRRWMNEGLKQPQKKGKGKAKENGADSDVEIVEAKPEVEKAPAAPPAAEDVEMTNGDAAPAGPALEGNFHVDSSPLTSEPAQPAPAPDDLPDPSTVFRSSPSPPAITELDNTAIECQHGMLNPKKAEWMKRVSQMGIMALRELGVEVKPELMAGKDFCRECVGAIAADFMYTLKHPDDVKKYDDADKASNEARTVLLSKDWLRDWRKDKPKMHQPGTLDDPSPSDEPYIHDIQCEHGKIQPDPKRRITITPSAASVLKKLFKGWKPMDGVSCSICEGTMEVDKERSEENKQVAVKEKKVLKALENMFQSRLTGQRLPISSDNEAHFVVPREWCRQWCSWAKQRNPDHKARPGVIDNSGFLCEHDLLCLDLVREVEGQNNVEVVGVKEWKYLTKAYDASPPIRIWQEAALERPSSDPEVCQDCLEAKRHNFATTELLVKQLSADDIDADGNRKPHDAAPSANPSAQGLGSLKTYGQRASTRLKTKPGLLFQKQHQRIEMAKDDQVKDLKRKIEEATRIPIIAQRLFYHHQELLDASVSVADLGLASNDTLEVYAVDMDNVDFSKLEDVTPKTRRGKRGRVEGFGGTGLAGFSDGDFVEADGEMEVGQPNGSGSGGASTNGTNGKAPSSSSSATAAPEETGSLSCPTCTFVNAEGMTRCEMCDSVLSG
ncbi:hypothetical protein JCM10213_006348 [Rhodosporidiobolus nylandii]